MRQVRRKRWGGGQTTRWRIREARNTAIHSGVEEGYRAWYEMLEQLILNLVRASHGSPGNPVYRLASIEARIVFHPRSARSVYFA